MEMRYRPRSFNPHHDVVFILEGQPACDCDDDPFKYEIWRRTWRDGCATRIARTNDFDQAIGFLRSEMEAIETERATGTVVTA